ncbi:class I SAM-dependent methyltransferase [Sphingobium nicotianae]|uniref:Methyltransferase domain-containing protein n=1 Tax=Sphingobium nicotianae TaxID=2782607 RepID=A0A9X1DEP2_9SPHN|nr:methyltransferase domain-containing protein [Sphingobium nicotianae]MBT2188822.1 methyltransferase domain-containing protein [Sphingobium nicotianae]
MQDRVASRALHASAWAEVADLLDQQLSPLGQRAIVALAPVPGDVILDIGCGTGQTLLQLAALVGPTGRVIGVDIAPRLLAIAASRAVDLQTVDFLEADAAVLPLPDGIADGVFSRFGVMGFGDPIAAFSHFHRLLRRGGRLAFVCWRALEENELDYLPLHAAGLEAKADRTPFSFEDPGVIRSVLETAGFREISLSANDTPVSCGDLDATMAVVMRVGALGKILREDPGLRDTCDARVRDALSARTAGTQVRLMAATWTVSARA